MLHYVEMIKNGKGALILVILAGVQILVVLFIFNQSNRLMWALLIIVLVRLYYYLTTRRI